MALEARNGHEGVRAFDLFVTRAEIKLAKVDAEQIEIPGQYSASSARGVMRQNSISEIAFLMRS